jgi:hypothetical protein
MRSYNRLVGFCLALVMASFCAGAAAASPKALVEARLVDAEQLGLVGSGMNVNVAFRLTFRVTRVLSGHFRRRRVITYAVQEARPREGLDYFLLVENSPAEDRVDWYSLKMLGLCIPDSDVQELGAGNDIDVLRGKYPCHG